MAPTDVEPHTEHLRSHERGDGFPVEAENVLRNGPREAKAERRKGEASGDLHRRHASFVPFLHGSSFLVQLYDELDC